MRWYLLLFLLLAMEPQLAAGAARNQHEAPSSKMHRVPVPRQLEQDGLNLDANVIAADSKKRTLIRQAKTWLYVTRGMTLICFLLFFLEVLINPNQFNLKDAGRQFDMPTLSLSGVPESLKGINRQRVKDAKRGMIIITGSLIFIVIIFMTFYDLKSNVKSPSKAPILDYFQTARDELQKKRDEQHLNAESLLEIGATTTTLTGRINRKSMNTRHDEEGGLSPLWQTSNHLLYKEEGDSIQLATNLNKWFKQHPREEMPIKVTAHYMKKAGYGQDAISSLIHMWDADGSGSLSEYEMQFLGESRYIETHLFEGVDGKLSTGLILIIALCEFMAVTTRSFLDRTIGLMGLVCAFVISGLLVSKVWYQLHQSPEGHKHVFNYFAELTNSGCTRFSLALVIILALGALYNQAMGRCLPSSFECANGAVPICLTTGFPPLDVSCGTGREEFDKPTKQCPMADYAAGDILNMEEHGEYTYSKFDHMLEWTKDAVCLDEKAPVKMSYFQSDFATSSTGKCEVAEAFGSPICTNKKYAPYCKCTDTDEGPARLVAYTMSSNYLEPTETQNLLRSVDSRSAKGWPPTTVGLAVPGSNCKVRYATKLVASEWCSTAANGTLVGEISLDPNNCPSRSYKSCHSSCGSCYTGDQGLSYRPEELCTSCPHGMNMQYVKDAGSSKNTPYRCHGKCVPNKIFQNKPSWCSLCDECDPLSRTHMAIRTPEHETGRSMYDLCYTDAISYKEEDPTENTTWYKVDRASVMTGTPAKCGSNNCKRADFTDSIGNSYMDSLYFALVTHTTIGYGDISPTSNRGYLIVVMHAILMIVFGFLL